MAGTRLTPTDPTDLDHAVEASTRPRLTDIHWYEPVAFGALVVAFVALLRWIGQHVYDWSFESNARFATTHDELLHAHSQAVTSARGTIVLTAIVLILIVAIKTGYRGRDSLIVIVPIVGYVLIAKLLWRLACIRRHYWAPAPTPPMTIWRKHPKASSAVSAPGAAATVPDGTPA